MVAQLKERMAAAEKTKEGEIRQRRNQRGGKEQGPYRSVSGMGKPTTGGTLRTKDCSRKTGSTGKSFLVGCLRGTRGAGGEKGAATPPGQGRAQ